MKNKKDPAGEHVIRQAAERIAEMPYDAGGIEDELRKVYRAGQDSRPGWTDLTREQA